MRVILISATALLTVVGLSAQDIRVQGSGELKSERPTAPVLPKARPASTTNTANKPLTNADVIAMVKGGLAESTVLLAIQQDARNFDTSPQALLALKNAGVSSTVIETMLRSNTTKAEETSAPATTDGVLTNEGVLKMVQSGASEDEVIEAIRRGPTKFDLSSDGMNQLVVRGHLSPTVMQAIGYSYGMSMASGMRVGSAGSVPNRSPFPASEKLSPQQVQDALAGTGRNRWVEIQDMGLMAAQGAQVPAITLFMPQAMIAIRSDTARQEFRHYELTEEDQRNALTIVARGYAGKTMSSGCTDITRIVLLSSESGGVIEEAYLSEPLEESWRNGFGATDSCQRLRAKFSMDAVKRVKAAAPNGEFFVAVFSGSSKTKVYKVKNKHQSKLGL